MAVVTHILWYWNIVHVHVYLALPKNSYNCHNYCCLAQFCYGKKTDSFQLSWQVPKDYSHYSTMHKWSSEWTMFCAYIIILLTLYAPPLLYIIIIIAPSLYNIFTKRSYYCTPWFYCISPQVFIDFAKEQHEEWRNYRHCTCIYLYGIYTWQSSCLVLLFKAQH